jgi:hypothetical protein
MTAEATAILVSLLALFVAFATLLSERQAAWSIRYYERWFQMAQLVLARPEILLPLWCDAEQFQRLYADRIAVDGEPSAEELLFTEMYVDFVLEVHSRRRLGALLTGGFPGRVPLTNPRALHLWREYVRSMYSDKQQRTIDRAIAAHG